MDLDHLLVVSLAHDHKIDPPLALALAEKESTFDRWAWNPEPRYRYLWDVHQNAPFRPLTAEENVSEVPPADFPSYHGVPRDAEWWGQQASWGMMQIMGAVARENGFVGRHFPQLCEPKVGLPLSFRHFSKYLARYHDVFRALEAYNGGPGAVGRNAKYATEVLARVGRFKTP